jgi:hypothetical protein
MNNETITKEEKMRKLAKEIANDVLSDSYSHKPGESDSVTSYTDVVFSEYELDELADMITDEIGDSDERAEEIHKIVGLYDCDWARKYARLVVDEVRLNVLQDDDEDVIELETSYSIEWRYVCGDSAACDSMLLEEVEFNKLLGERDGGIYSGTDDEGRAAEYCDAWLNDIIGDNADEDYDDWSLDDWIDDIAGDDPFERLAVTSGVFDD